jgi:hypothetical protein
MRMTHIKSIGVRIAVVLVLCALFAGAYVERGWIRSTWAELTAPRLPSARAYVPVLRPATGAGGQEVTSPFEPGYSSSERYMLETAPQPKTPSGDPLVFRGVLPAEINLDVPFTTQAPNANWDYPYQEACEEASAIMVDAFYDGRTGKIPAAEADDAIKKIVAYEKATLGFYEDTNAEQTAAFIKGYFGYKRVLVKPLTSAEDIQKVLALGYPVIVPFAGKLLGNPNFRNGGPPYHMLVIRGYTDSDLFITNDPGTRNGLAYTYSFDTILKAAHEWVGTPETVTQGKKYMIVVLPQEGG